MKNIVVFDIGGTAVKAGVMSSDGMFLNKDEMHTPATKEGLFACLSEYVVGQQAFAPVAVSISMPGFINSKAGYVIRGGALVYLDECEFVSELETVIGLPVMIENDARCVALAEQLNGHAQGLDNYVCVTIGTGIGVGIIINNEPFIGSHFRGGEFGMSLVERTESGRYKMMHNTASTAELVSMYKRAMNLPREAQVNGKEIFADESETALAVLERWYERIAVVVFNAIAAYDPQKVLIGGGVSGNPRLLDNILRVMPRVATEKWVDLQVPVEYCMHRNDAGMIGALCHYNREH
ncbi:ROK family protein [Culicoidibacter larvae]|uniref:ROK family protein n=1 Tax=Culicoidibacter larvae TaxID=2579976 RepID=A0A5R8QA02_9FIRM|nr:ROK family protein [Culicoidibacter larvae]TLG72730.1 ROK family protein [Culicoidibacter larvae]